jgi:hypothetical protein
MDRWLAGWNNLWAWVEQHPWLTGVVLGGSTAALAHFAFDARWGYVLPFVLIYPLGAAFWRWVRSGNRSAAQTEKAVSRARSAGDRKAAEARVPPRLYY